MERLTIKNENRITFMTRFRTYGTTFHSYLYKNALERVERLVKRTTGSNNLKIELLTWGTTEKVCVRWIDVKAYFRVEKIRANLMRFDVISVCRYVVRHHLLNASNKGAEGVKPIIVLLSQIEFNAWVNSSLGVSLPVEMWKITKLFSPLLKLLTHFLIFIPISDSNGCVKAWLDGDGG